MNDLEVKQPQRTMMIKNLCPGLAEVGKIKIGNKGSVRKSASGSEWQPPQKLDHFLITTLERGADGNYLKDEALHKRLGGENIKLIPIRLLFDDIGLNFATRYVCYYGKTIFCSGDGETATRLQKDGTWSQRTCPCGRQDPKYAGDDGPHGPDAIGGNNSKGKCKINGILSTLIDGAEMVGGVWKFRTTSYNSVVGILSTLALVHRVTGGRLAGIPLNMTVSPKTTQDPIKGGQVTIQVVGIHYPGSMNALRDTGYQIAFDEAKHGISMAHIEEQAMKMLSFTPVSGIGDDTPEDVIEEFYPEEAVDVMGGVNHREAPPLIGADIVQEKQEETPDGNIIIPAVNLGREGTGAPPVPPRERTKPSAGHAKRTKVDMAEDAAADEADRIAAEQKQEPALDPEPETSPGCPHPEDETEWQQTGAHTEDLICLSCGQVLDTREPAPDLPDLGTPVAEKKAAVDLF